MPEIQQRAARAERGTEKGTAMLEFVLSLPFIWIVLLLIFNFGQAFLERHRTLVAVREMAIRRGVARDRIDDQFERLKLDTLDVRRLSARFEMTDGGNCPRQDEALDQGRVNGALSSDLGWIGNAVSGVLSSLSRTQTYNIRTEGPPIAGHLLATRPYGACFAIDDQTWTHDETGDYLDLFGRVIKSAWPF